MALYITNRRLRKSLYAPPSLKRVMAMTSSSLGSTTRHEPVAPGCPKACSLRPSLGHERINRGGLGGLGVPNAIHRVGVPAHGRSIRGQERHGGQEDMVSHAGMFYQTGMRTNSITTKSTKDTKKNGFEAVVSLCDLGALCGEGFFWRGLLRGRVADLEILVQQVVVLHLELGALVGREVVASEHALELDGAAEVL